jgi:hyperosmotically inducible protein
VTRKGQVQLSGYVDNQSQIKHVIQITRKVEGVVGVNNEMSLKR